MDPTSGFVDSSGLRIHYLDWGGSGPPAVLLHPSSFCADIWRPAVEAMAPRLRCIAMDLRGHGRSDPPLGAISWEELASDLVCLLDQLDIRRALVAGHSRGGGVSLLATAQRLDRVKSLVLIEPNLIDRPGQQAADRTRRAVERAGRRRAVWPDRETLFGAYRQRPIFTHWRDEALWAYINGGFKDGPDGQVQLACAPEVEAAYYEAKIGRDVWEAVAQLDLPALLVAAEGSDRFRLDAPHAQKFLSTAPDVRSMTVPGGHFVVQENPEDIAKVILEFAVESGVISA